MRRVLLPHHIAADPAPAGAAVHSFAGHSMGTTWSVRLAAAPDKPVPEELQELLQQQLDIVVAEMSHWEADSNLGRFNRAAAGTWHVLPRAFFDVLTYAVEVGRLSGDAYDPSAGNIVNRWGFGPSNGSLHYEDPAFTAPAPDEVERLRAQRLASRIQLDPDRKRAYQPGRVQLDLSAVAKGYSVDRLAYFLSHHGVKHFLAEVGGELRGAGMRPDGQPWWVELEPLPDSGLPGMVLALHGLSVATSGDYRKFFMHGGQRYAHTIDPRTAMPVANGLASVTVVHPQCMAADAWSTALTVLGPQHGLAMAERQGLAARFVLRDGDGPACTELISSAMQAMLDEDE
ncbi:FAD:protein FMN transferase [Pseudoduganella ginsengisoli]|uniref:FAD:protein FMN transferase n=1 Tax=Pseudoduganella ginsengisoli TaxID=1462440 RepID=A0A6L6PZN8_9BURK|nr:FAD:protein FMN transferase [Pseudoduganella ginsengisoli]MTW02845.1 FAD:protein FMN transferase [Pseudoduganella ginsengisoli]